ncbi:MAG: DUF938 domain-containing protein [Caulobacteraceae bacterium]|nr:DUF938 domain-containing protein [Caulobacteraceae bacterium]
MKPAAGLTSEYAARNFEPILRVLKERLPHPGRVLEIASGTGEHALWMAEAMPDITWQPTDLSPVARESIDAWRLSKNLPNLNAPMPLDAAAPHTWLFGKADAIVCINMVHISPFDATQGLMKGAGQVLEGGGMLFLYGPFSVGGKHTAPSNEAFDADLKARNPEWGVRDVQQVRAAGRQYGLVLTETIAMPANNLSLVFRKQAAG